MTFNAGDLLTAAALNDAFNPAWTAFNTFTWTASTTSPTIGNGTKTGRYRRNANGNLVIYEFFILFGSTTTRGTGVYQFGLPVNASANSQLPLSTGSAVLLRSAVQKWGVSSFINNATTCGFAGNAGDVGSTWAAWAAPDYFSCHIEYEPA